MTTMAGSIPPSSSTFSFTAPFPPPTTATTPASPSLKQQRRVSLALPSSPRQFAAWSFRDDTTVGVAAGLSQSSATEPEKKGKIRRIASEYEEDDSLSTPSTSNVAAAGGSINGEPPKKARKKWTAQETQMLVDGCNKWGVGNWKTILNDPELQFDNRSPVDLKDRFRTYFPDAYKHHYPNARTHLSSKTRSMHPDGTPLFCASRSKKRRPFTPEEDAALKAGYDKHGTVWAAIVKDPIFQDQHRRSTDLRDRFRNAWPELYAKAGYKPRATAGKKKRLAEGEVGEDGASRYPGRVQPARAATDDQLPTTSTMSGPIRRKRRHTTQGFGLFRGGTKSVPESMANSEDEDSGSEDEVELSQAADMTGTLGQDMDVEVSSTDPGVPDFASSSSLTMSDITDSSHSQSQSGVASWLDIDSTSHPWSSSRTPNPAFADSLAASPTPSTDYLLPHSPVSMATNSMIGKSAWGTQDWLSPNPRLDAGGLSPGNGNSFTNSGLFSPSPIGSPSVYAANQPHSLSLAHVSFNHLSLPGSHSHGLGGYAHSHGVVDRYDLFPMSHDLDLDLDFVSEGFGGTGDAHSAFSDPSAWAGASDMRRGGFTHHSNYAGDLIFGARTHQPTGHTRMDYGPGFGFGLGLEGVQPSSVLHTPALPGIDEIELTNITLEDPREPDDALAGATAGELLGSGVSSPSAGSQESFMPLALDELVGIPSSDPVDEPHASQGIVDPTPDTSNHVTPPATPAIGYRVSARTPGFSTSHHRSISVPPSEHRAFLPPRTGQSQAVSPKAKHKSLMAAPTRTAFAVPSLPPSVAAQQQSGHIPPAWLHNPPSDSDTYRVPFLDLHYYCPPGIDAQLASHASMAPPASGAQALDLAQTLAQTLGQPNVNGPKPLCIPPSLMQLVPDPNLPGGHSRGSSHHQRGQSVVVSPQDLELRKVNDNKRKRASWDGGPR